MESVAFLFCIDSNLFQHAVMVLHYEYISSSNRMLHPANVVPLLNLFQRFVMVQILQGNISYQLVALLNVAKVPLDSAQALGGQHCYYDFNSHLRGWANLRQLEILYALISPLDIDMTGN